MAILFLSKSWTLRAGQNQLLCSAGADQLFAIDEVAADVLEEIVQAAKKYRFNQDKLSGTANELLEQLLSAGIVKPNLVKSSKKYRLWIHGSKNYADKLERVLNDLDVSFVPTSGEADLGIILRINQTYASLLDALDYSLLKKPHLLLDLAYHHTISIGPLVFPGQTACLACLQGRLTNRWGDDPLPMQSEITDHFDLAVLLLRLELVNILKKEDYGLVQKTIVYDFEERRIQLNPLYKVPLCPICANNKLDISGKVRLPWA